MFLQGSLLWYGNFSWSNDFGKRPTSSSSTEHYLIDNTENVKSVSTVDNLTFPDVHESAEELSGNMKKSHYGSEIHRFRTNKEDLPAREKLRAVLSWPISFYSLRCEVSSSMLYPRHFKQSNKSRPTLGPTEPTTQMESWVPSPKVNRPQREADHSSPSIADVKNSWNLPPHHTRYIYVYFCTT
jgi:hypothetical protein